jgi:hypothetical protein
MLTSAFHASSRRLMGCGSGEWASHGVETLETSGPAVPRADTVLPSHVV